MTWEHKTNRWLNLNTRVESDNEYGSDQVEPSGVIDIDFARSPSEKYRRLS